MVRPWMRISVLGLAASGICGAAFSQGVVKTGLSSGVVGVCAPDPAQNKPNPYSMTSVTTRVQTLSDGTQIRTRTEAHQMVDSEGRTRDETICVRVQNPSELRS